MATPIDIFPIFAAIHIHLVRENKVMTIPGDFEFFGGRKIERTLGGRDVFNVIGFTFKIIGALELVFKLNIRISSTLFRAAPSLGDLGRITDLLESFSNIRFYIITNLVSSSPENRLSIDMESCKPSCFSQFLEQCSIFGVFSVKRNDPVTRNCLNNNIKGNVLEGFEHLLNNFLQPLNVFFVHSWSAAFLHDSMGD
ncbi:MAG: hypothetical protein A2V67_14370 [Deltaproteobacteria bacterium RBG_13_61_14]|nr:MAG: hypothetical protein A2V67_14370 [Deltaproteobacteria bacterium RBG_13_61_14]